MPRNGSKRKHINDHQIPSAGSGFILLKMDKFVVPISKNLPFSSWKGILVKHMDTQVDNAIDNFFKAGSELKPDQHKYTTDDNVPSADAILLRVAGFVFPLPKSLPVNCWKGEIMKNMDTALEEGIYNTFKGDCRVVRVKRAIQTVPSDFEEHDTLKHKKMRRLKKEPYDSSEIPVVGRNQAARCVSPKVEADSVDILHPAARGVSPKVEADSVDSLHPAARGVSPKVEADNVDTFHQAPPEPSLRQRLQRQTPEASLRPHQRRT